MEPPHFDLAIPKELASRMPADHAGIRMNRIHNQNCPTIDSRAGAPFFNWDWPAKHRGVFSDLFCFQVL